MKLTWHLPEPLFNSPAVSNRNLLAQKYATADADTILSNYVYMDKAAIEREFRLVFGLLEPFVFEGCGLEVGAGVAPFSAMVCRDFPKVSQLYAIEVVPDVVKLLQPKAVAHIAGETAGKVVGVLGSFDDIELPDRSCDFAIEIGSLHHSDNLLVTLKEISRVLRPGGHLVMLDRMNADRLGENQRQRMLDLAYTKEWKARNGYPPDPLTRRDNGEHEIRLSEWRAALDEAGFELVRWRELRMTGWGRLWWAAKLLFPYSLRKRFDIAPTRVSTGIAEVLWMLGHQLGLSGMNSLYAAAERDHTLMLVRKR